MPHMAYGRLFRRQLRWLRPGGIAAGSTESNRMDLYAMFVQSIESVFDQLADPSRLGDWLPQVAVSASRALDDAEATFTLTVEVDGVPVAATGEMTAFEPPWLVGYRLFIGSRAHGLRVTCTTQPGGTRIHVHQPDDDIPLTIDLARLSRTLGHDTGEGASC